MPRQSRIARAAPLVGADVRADDQAALERAPLPATDEQPEKSLEPHLLEAVAVTLARLAFRAQR